MSSSQYALLKRLGKAVVYTETAIPHYLRFNMVQLRFVNRIERCPVPKPIEAKCEWAQKNLWWLSQALIGSAFKFECAIDKTDPYDFNNPSKLLEYLGRKFLTIVRSSRSYEFKIIINSEWESAGMLIASILQFDAISNCSNVCLFFEYTFTASLELYKNPDFVSKQFMPTDAISNWLHRNISSDSMGINEWNTRQTAKERFLEIRRGIALHPYIWKHLKKVVFLIEYVFKVFE